MVFTGTVVTPYPTGTTSGSNYTTGTVVNPYPSGDTSGTGSGGGSTPLPVPPDQISTVTGIDPNEVAAATMGKIIPIWVGGMPRMGAHIIYGPTVTITGGIPSASFGVSFGMPANNLGTRELREIRLDGFKVWTLAEGALISNFTHRFYPGTETQAADPLVIAAFPGAPVAHKGQCCIFIENLPLTDYNNKVPFVSALIADTTSGVNPIDGVNLGDALEQIAASPYINITFETVGISERVDAIIVAEKIAFIDLCVRYSDLHLWDVVQRDKLKIIEHGTVDPDVTLNLTQILADTGNNAPITIDRQQQDELARELEYSYIDLDRDYEINSVTASRPNAPMPVTVSAGKNTIALPSVHTVQEATSWATLRLYKDEVARDRVSFTTSIYGFEIEPGDVVSVDAGFKTYILRVLETLHGANWTNRIIGEPVLRCAVPISSAPLTDIACLTGAWSMSRQLVSTYSGEFYTAISTAVSRIADQTGNSRHFNDAGASTRPVVATGGPNSRACADFDGTNHYLDTVLDLSTFITNSAAYVIISVIVDAVTLNDVDPQDNHCLIGDDGQKFGIYARNLSALTLYGFNFNGSADAAAKDDKDLATALVISLRHEDGNIYLRTNVGTDVLVASGNTSDLTGDLRLAASAVGLKANMKFFEGATFNCVPNEGIRNGIEEDFRHWIGAVLETPAGQWTPADLGSGVLKAWYDFSDTTTITHLSGAVSQVNDKSGNGNHITQSTPADRPTTGANTLNGLNVVTFDGTDFLARTSSVVLPGANPGAMLFALRLVTSGTGAGLVWTCTNAGPSSDSCALGRSGGNMGAWGDGTNDSTSIAAKYADSDNTNWHLSGGVYDWDSISASSRKIYEDGVLKDTNTVNLGVPNTPDELRVGLALTFNRAATIFLTGRLAQVLIVNSVDQTTREKIEGWAMWNYGLQSQLPIGHPYKNAAP